MCPQVEPVLVVQEELPVADDRLPHQQNRHGRGEWPKARVVDRGPLVAFVEPSHHESIIGIRRNGEMLEDLVEELSCTIRRQIGEDNDE